MDGKQFGLRVRLSRDDLGLTQEEVAARAGISRTHLTNIEKGRRANPGIEAVIALSKVLGVTINYLVGETEDPLPGNSSSSSIHESHVVYEVETPTDRQRAQRLLDIFFQLPPQQQAAFQTFMEHIYESSTPRIIGHE